MPNLIITKNCNLNCDYCFAGNNYKGKKYEISLGLYLLYLKHLKLSNDNQIRLIGGEPLLYSNLKKILCIGIKGGFKILIFSNLTLINKKIRNIFNGFGKNITINININRKGFYKNNELNNIFKNIEYLIKNNFRIILSYLVYGDNFNDDFVFKIAEKYNIKDIHLKPYNSNGKEYKTNTYEYGNRFYKLIQKYGKLYNIFISCGFSENILTVKQKENLKNNFNIDFKYGCQANGGKYDIDYNGNIFRCFALKEKFKDLKLNLKNYYYLDKYKIIEKLNLIIDTKSNRKNCLGYRI